MTRIQSNRDGAARSHAHDSSCGAFDIGGVDIAAGHDDHVLDSAAHHDVPVLGQITQITGVQPAVLILCGNEPAHGDVAGRQGFSAQFDHADTAGRQRVALLIDDARLDILQQRPQGSQPAGIALCCRNGAAQCGQQIGVDLVDDQSCAALGERHRQRRLGHTVSRQDRLRPQPERLPRIQQVLHVGGIDRLGAGQRESQRRQVELARLGLAAQPLGEQCVGEVRRRGHGALVLVDELGPQQRVPKEVQWGDLDQFGAEIHRNGQEPDHAHIVEAGQPADHHVRIGVIPGADEHRFGIGVDIAVGDHHGLRRAGRARCQLHQGDVILFGLERIDGLGCEQLLDGEDHDAPLSQDRPGHQERLTDHDGFGLDHVDDVGGVLRPVFEVGARGGLMQHRQARAAHPQCLGGGRDLDRGTREDADGIAAAHPGGGQTAGDAPGTLVHLTPGVSDRFQGFPGHHALLTGHGTVEHLVRESAHDDLLGIRLAVANGALARKVMLRPPRAIAYAARPYGCGAFRSRIGDASSARPPHGRPTRFPVDDPQFGIVWPLMITATHLNLSLRSRQTHSLHVGRVRFRVSLTG